MNCPTKFSTAEQLYCYGTCGYWLDNTAGCQKRDADAYCKLKLCNENAHAFSYETSEALHSPGFSCNGYGTNFGNFWGMRDVHFEDNIGSTHGQFVSNAVVSTVKCEQPGNLNINLLLVTKKFELVLLFILQFISCEIYSQLYFC